jgi:hypothetical protein
LIANWPIVATTNASQNAPNKEADREVETVAAAREVCHHPASAGE